MIRTWLATFVLLLSSVGQAEMHMPAGISGRIEDFALTTCEPHLQCYRIVAKVARPSLTGSADLKDLNVQILDLSGAVVLKSYTAPEGFYDSRTRTLVARKIEMPNMKLAGHPDAFLNFGTGHLTLFPAPSKPSTP